MKKISKQQKKKIWDLLENMDWFFATKNHERGIVWAKENNPENPDVTAEIHMTERYNRFVITIYPHFFEHKEEEQRMFLLHEMCHMLVRPVQHEAQQLRDGNIRTQDQISYAVENVTSRITYLLDVLLLGGRQYMKEEYVKFGRSKKLSIKKKKHMASKKPAAKPMKKVAPKKK